MLALVVQNHPNRTGPDFRREFVRRLACHGSHLLKSWSLRQSRGGSHLVATRSQVIVSFAMDHQDMGLFRLPFVRASLVVVPSPKRPRPRSESSEMSNKIAQ